MKRFLTFLFAASALLAGGCSDSDTDDPAPPEAPAPVIKLPEAVAASPLSVSPEGGTSWFEYEVENPVEGEAIAELLRDSVSDTVYFFLEEHNLDDDFDIRAFVTDRNW